MPAVAPRKTRTKSESELIQDEIAVDESDADALRTAKLLAAAPALTPYIHLRVGKRKYILGIAERMNDANPEGTEVDLDVEGMYDLLDEMDKALEAVAVDPAAYAAWAIGADAEEKVSTLFAWYAEQVGNSIGSAN